MTARIFSSPDAANGADGGAPRRLLALLAVAGFTSMASVRMCDAMLPALAGAFATGTAEAAQVISYFALAYGAMQLVYGPLADRFGKPRLIGIAAALCALGAIGAALAPTLSALGLARIVMGAGAAGIIPLALAWIGDRVGVESRQAVLARYSGATISGVVLGAWLGGFFAETVGWRAGFFGIAALFAAVAGALALRRADAGTETAAAATPRLSTLQQWRALAADPWARRVLLSVGAEGAIAFGATAFVPTLLHERFGLPLTQAGAVLAAFGLGGVLFSLLSPWLLKRLSTPAMAAQGAGAVAAGMLMLAWLPHWALAAAACTLAGLGFYGLHNTLQMSATQLSPRSRGTAVSLFAAVFFLGQSLGVTVAAWSMHALGPLVLFGIAAAAFAALGASFAAALRRRRDQDNR